MVMNDKIISKCDIFIEGFRPGVIERLVQYLLLFKKYWF